LVGPGALARSALAVARRPDLWWTAIREALVLASPGWWRHWPPVPVPGQAYLQWRLQTAYGSSAGPSAAEVPTEDLIGYLDWCRRMRRMRSEND
jgi:hypothetical protein